MIWLQNEPLRRDCNRDVITAGRVLSLRKLPHVSLALLHEYFVAFPEIPPDSAAISRANKSAFGRDWLVFRGRRLPTLAWEGIWHMTDLMPDKTERTEEAVSVQITQSGLSP